MYLKRLFNIENKVGDKFQQDLSIRIGENYSCFAITDKEGNELYHMTYVTVQKWDEQELNDFFAANPILLEPFYQVIIAYDFSLSTFVPEEEYNYEDAGLYLRTLPGFNDSISVVSDAITERQLYNIYAVPSLIHHWMNNKFPAAKFWHHYSIVIKSKQTSTDNIIYIDFQNEKLLITVFSQSRFLLAQSFEYSTPDDVMYYLLKACFRFSFTQQDVHLRLSGLIDKNSSLYKGILQYFLNVEFANASWDLPGEYPEHYFTSLNDLAKCVL